MVVARNKLKDTGKNKPSTLETTLSQDPETKEAKQAKQSKAKQAKQARQLSRPAREQR
jgi:hypothetical protein